MFITQQEEIGLLTVEDSKFTAVEKSSKMNEPNLIPDMVSVIMPAYNAEKWIDCSIQSVVKQTYVSWELIVIDDASEDGTVEIVKQWVSNDKRISLLKNEFSKGAAGARNTGILHSRGKYIAFLDSDDLWLPDKLQIQTEYMTQSGASLCHSFYEMFDVNGKSKVISSKLIVDFNDIVRSCDVGCLTVMIDKVAVGEDFWFPESPKEDYALWIILLRKGHSFVCCPRVMARYRRGYNTISANKLEELRKQYFVLRKHSGASYFAASFYMMTYIAKGVKKHWFS